MRILGNSFHLCAFLMAADESCLTFSGERTTPLRTNKCAERFSPAELLGLQCDLQQIDVDSWQASEMLAAFLNGRGYGVDTVLVQESLLRLELSNCDVDSMQDELQRVALVM